VGVPFWASSRAAVRYQKQLVLEMTMAALPSGPPLGTGRCNERQVQLQNNGWNERGAAGDSRSIWTCVRVWWWRVKSVVRGFSFLGDGSMGGGKRREEERQGINWFVRLPLLTTTRTHMRTHAHTHTQTLTLSASLAYHNNTAQKTQTRREKTWTGLHRSLPTSSVPPATFNW
jgi:hypothetical protein